MNEHEYRTKYIAARLMRIWNRYNGRTVVNGICSVRDEVDTADWTECIHAEYLMRAKNLLEHMDFLFILRVLNYID